MPKNSPYYNLINNLIIQQVGDGEVEQVLCLCRLSHVVAPPYKNKFFNQHEIPGILLCLTQIIFDHLLSSIPSEQMVQQYYNDECTKDASGSSDEKETFGVKDIQGLFYILGAGVAMGFICLIIQASGGL